MEQIDVFDSSYAPLSPSAASIDTVHAQGLWHQTFSCWIINPHNRSVLLQLRGPRNRIDAGSFDASASGHLSSGETPEHGFREVQEELGISIGHDERIYLGYFRNIAVRGTYINNEFCHVFLATSLATPQDLALQQGEVSGIFEADIDDMMHMLREDRPHVRTSGIQWIEGSYHSVEKNVSLKDMCNWKNRAGSRGYYLQSMQAAIDFLHGNPLSFACDTNINKERQ